MHIDMNIEMFSKPRQRNWRLIVARVVWIVLAAFALLVLVALAPINARNVISDWQVDLSYPAVHNLFPSRAAYASYILIIRYLAAAVFLLIAGIIFWRRSNDGMAIFVSLILLLIPLAFNYGGYSETWSLYDPATRQFLSGVHNLLSILSIVCFLTLFFVFPDGRFVPRWMRWIVLAMILVGIGFYIGTAIGSTTDWGEGSGEIFWLIWVATIIAGLVLGLAGQIYRYQRLSNSAQRQQTKWIVFGLALQPAWLLFSLVSSDSVWPASTWLGLINLHAQVIVPTLIPLTIGLSIMRHRLWDIDLLINRTLVYGALTAFVIGLYVIAVGVLSALFQTGGDVLFSIVVTGLIAVMFHPLRERLQRAVNRLMYGERDDPATVLSRLGQRLESAVAPGAVLSTIVETIANTLKLPYVAIALRMDERSASDDEAISLSEEFVVAAAYGPRVDDPQIFPLIYQSETVGQLILGSRAHGESFSHNDRRLLESIAHQAGVAAHAVRLTRELQRSRERLVTSREEERRRIRRDLHDGLGPTLASQALKLETALDLLEGDVEARTQPDPPAAAEVLRELKTQTKATVAEIRQLVYELRPPALDEVGLIDALRQHVARYNGSMNGLRISVEAPDDLPSLSAAVEVATYRIVSEAVTNVVRHARASGCIVRLSVADMLNVIIEDDGIGIAADVHFGVGLASMRERAAELGGTCEVRSMPQGGTRVTARLPWNT